MENITLFRKKIGDDYFIDYDQDGNAWFGVAGQGELVPIRYVENTGLYPREKDYPYEFDKILLMITPGDRTLYMEDGGLNLYTEKGEIYAYGSAQEMSIRTGEAFGDYHMEAIATCDGSQWGIYLTAPNGGNKILLKADLAEEDLETAMEEVRRDIFTEDYMENVEDQFRFLIGIDMEEDF